MTSRRQSALKRLAKENSCCTARGCGSRPRYVFGTGDPEAEVMIIGEAPGLEEDRRGEPFVGRAGKLLNRLLESIHLRREDVYITNIVKCHPMKDPSHPDSGGNDRPPKKKEISAFMPVLEKQIAIIQPKIIVALGNTSARALLNTREGITGLRGTAIPRGNAKVIPTYHPAAVLRNPLLEKYIAADFKKIKEELSARSSFIARP